MLKTKLCIGDNKNNNISVISSPSASCLRFLFLFRLSLRDLLHVRLPFHSIPGPLRLSCFPLTHVVNLSRERERRFVVVVASEIGTQSASLPAFKCCEIPIPPPPPPAAITKHTHTRIVYNCLLFFRLSRTLVIGFQQPKRKKKRLEKILKYYY